MTVKKDRLKNLLSGNQTEPETEITEVNMNENISPIANIKVVWVGWGWWNAVNRMVELWLTWVEFIAINTDAQALFTSNADVKLNIWRWTTRWLWAWSNPEIGKKAAEESSEEIKQALDWADMIFITCWLGWWTWTWAAPVVAEIAKSLGALVVWIVTKPFKFEWNKRSIQAEEWYDALEEKIDTLITIPNDKILGIIDKKTPLTEAFTVVDEVLHHWVQWISDLIISPGLINTDFADVKSIMHNAWSAMMGIWFGSGEDRAKEAARSAIDSPLLELSIHWAKWLLFNITWWNDLSMFEIDEAARIITESCDPDANIIFGTTLDDNYSWDIKITVIATWFSRESQMTQQVSTWLGKSTIISGWNNKKQDKPSFARQSLSWVQQKQTSPSVPANSWFWQRPINNSNLNNNLNNSNNKTTDYWNNDLDVPAFLRNKK